MEEDSTKGLSNVIRIDDGRIEDHLKHVVRGSVEKNGFTSRVHDKKPPRRALPEALARANAKHSMMRAAIEHPLAHQKDRINLFVRTIGLGRARLKIGMVNLA